MLDGLERDEHLAQQVVQRRQLPRLQHGQRVDLLRRLLRDGSVDLPPAAEEYTPEAREPAGYRLSDADIKEQVCRRLVQDGELDIRVPWPVCDFGRGFSLVVEFRPFYDVSRLGAVVVKTITTEPRS